MGANYVGRETCAGCHPAQAASQAATPMAQAAEAAADGRILKRHPELTARFGPYTYRIVRQGNQSLYSVSDGRQTISSPMLWAFGVGEAGQTYLIKYGDVYYQSRVSYFSDTSSLDLTLGVPRGVPETLEDAIGQRMSATELRQCIACHMTNAVSRTQLHVETAVPGLSCEACHGPGGGHVAAIQSGKLQDLQIFNPAKLSGGELDDFCGSCHRSWWQVQLMHVSGVETVRFQPYRLENSRCWDAEDARISCLACHDPHRPRIRQASFYDTRCLSCHVAGGAKTTQERRGAACPKAARDCITCHMPKYELPGGHFKFTDHFIRVARPGEPFRE